MSDGRDASPSEIRADIEQTRERMGETLEELGTRLNPDRLKEKAKEAVHEATIGRVQNMARDTMDRASSAGRGLVDVVRDNPIPFALMAVGAGLVVFNKQKGAAEQAVHRVADGAATAAHSASDQARRQVARAGSGFDEQPLVFGAVAAALGLAAGYAMPATSRESELVGEKRDELVDKARGAVREKKEQVQHVAERVVQELVSTTATTVKEAAKAEGLGGFAD
jgi:ElaB/YqjD/DUF883 family membrane-anchored ribosome-binding protein